MKHFKIIIASLLVLGLVGCSQNNNKKELNIVTSFFPIHSLVKEMVGHEVEVIVDSDAHDFEPTAKQRVKIAEADLFFYHGAGFEFWFEDSMVNDGISVELSKGIPLLEDHDHDHEGHDHGAIDPHTWLDPANGKIMLTNIYESLIETDPKNKDLYQENFDTLTQEFDLLIQNYQTLTTIDNTTLVVDHHAYGYLEEGYNLKQEAIIEGVADGDVSFKQTERAIEKINTLNIKGIFVDPSYKNDIIDTIQKETNTTIYDLYTLEQGLNDYSYLEMLDMNYQSLSKGLGTK